MFKWKMAVMCVVLVLMLPMQANSWTEIVPDHWVTDTGNNPGQIFNSVNPLTIDVLFPDMVIDSLRLDSANVTLSNSGYIDFGTAGVSNYAIGLNADGGYNVTNVGTIDLTGTGGFGVDIYGIVGGGMLATNTNLHLYNTGTIDAHIILGGSTAQAVYSRTGTIQNENSIRSSVKGGVLGSAVGIGFEQGGQITNNGLIESVLDFDQGFFSTAAGITNLAGPLSITNTGTIQATISLANGGVVSGAQGIIGPASGQTINNSGTIEAIASGPDVFARGIYASGIVTNSGTISATSAQSDAWGILSDGAITVNNSGSIIAKAGAGSTDAGVFSSGDAIIVNSGLIQGDTYAIFMRSGAQLDLDNTGTLVGSVLLSTANDIVRLRSGSSVQGSIDAGAGNDTLLLQGAVIVEGDIMGFDAFTGENELDFTLRGNMDLGSGQGSVTSGRLIIMPGCTLTADTFHIMEHGELMGSGSVRGDVDNRGVVSPGTSPGTLTILGDYVHAPSATYMAEIESLGLGDLIDISGTATIQGGTLQVVATPGYYSSLYPNTVLVADGGVTGQFEEFSANSISPYLTFQPRYTGTSVQVVSTRTTPYETYAAPGVATTVAGVFSAFADTASWDMRSVIQGLDFSSPAEANVFYMQLSPEPYNALVDVTFGDIERFQDNLNDRLDDIRDVAGAIRAAGAADRAADSHDPATPTADRRWSIYAQATGNSGIMSSTSDRTGYTHHGAGFRAGADWLVTDEFALGAAIGYFESQIEYSDSLGRDASVNTLSAALYGMWSTDVSTNLDFFLDASAGWAHHWKRMRRAAGIGNVSRVLAAGWEEDSFFTSLRTGIDFQYEGFELTPYASLAYTHQHRPEITEDGGGALSQVVEAQDYDSLTTTVGAEMAYEIKLNEAATLTPRIQAAWRHEFLDSDRDMTARFVFDGGPFTVSGEHPARDQAILGAGLELSFNKRISIFADYQGAFSGDGSGHAVWGGLQVRF